MAIDINIKGIQDFNAAIDRLSKTLDRVEVNLTTLLKSGSAIDRLFGGMTNFRAFTKALSSVDPKAASTFRSLTKSMQELSRVVGSMPAGTGGASLVRDIKELIQLTKTGGLNNFKNFTKLLSKADPSAVKTFKALTKAMKELAAAVASIPSGGNGSFLRDIKELIQLTQTASVPAGGGRSPIAAIQALVRSILRLNTEIKAGASPRELISFIKDFAEVVTTISRVATQSNNLTDFDTFAKAIDRLGTGLKKLGALANDPSISGAGVGKFLKVQKFIIALGVIFETLNKVVSGSSKEGSGIDQFSFIIDRLGRGFRGLDSIKNLGVKKAIEISKFLAAMSIGLRIVGKISGQNVNAGAFATTISSVFDAIEKVSRLNVKTDLFRRTSFEIERPLKQLINVVLPLFERIAKSTKGHANLSGLAALFTALGNFFEKTASIKFKESNFKQFKNVARQIADGLNELERVNVNPAKLTAIASAITSFGDRLGGAQFRQTGFNLGDELKRGLIQAGFTAFFNRLLLGPLIAARGNATGLAQRLGSAIGHAIASGMRFVGSLISGLRQVGSNLRELGENFRTFGTNLNQTFGLGSLFQSGAFQSAIAFDHLSNQVQVFGNLTDEQSAVADEFASKIGIDYPLSANQAEEALLNLLKAGLDLNAAMQALPSAADLAALSDTGSVDTTSRILIQATQAFEQFNETTAASFENSAVAADLIAQAANNSTASVESLGEALVSVGPIASNMGLTLEETVAIFGLFADAGVQGAQAGTQLRSMLNGLTRPTEDVQNTFNELGISLTDQAGNIRNFNDIVNDLNSAMNEAQTVTISTNAAMSASDRERFEQAQRAYAVAIRNVNALRDGTSASAVAAGENAEELATRIGRFEQAAANAAGVISELSGSQDEAHRITVEIERSQIDNVRAIQSLAGTFGQVGLSVLLAGGEDAIAGFIDEMGRLPTAAEQAQLLLDDMAGDIEQLKGSFETLTKDVLIPIIARAFRPLVKALRFVVDGFNNASPVVKDFIANFILFGSTFATILAGLAFGIGVVISFGGVIATVTGVIGTFLLSHGLIVGAVAGFAASLAVLLVVATAVAGVFSLIAAGMTEFFTLTERNIGGAGTQFENFGRMLGDIAKNIGIFLSAIGDVAKAIFLPQLEEDQLRRGQQLANIIQRINSALLGVVRWSRDLAEFASGFADFLSFGGRLQEFSRGLEDAFGSGAVQNTDEFREAFLRDYRQMLEAVGRNPIVQRMLGLDRAASREEVLRFFEGIRDQIQLLVTDLSQIGGGLIGILFGTEGADQQIAEAAKRLMARFIQLLKAAGGVDLTAALITSDDESATVNLQLLVDTLMEKIKDFILGHREAIVDALTSLFNFLLPGKMLVTIAEFLGLTELAALGQSVFDALSEAFKNLVNTIFDVVGGKSIEEALLGNFGPAIAPVIRLVKALGRTFNSIIGIFTNLADALFPGGGKGKGGEKSFFEVALDGIASAVEFLNTNILDPLVHGKLPEFLQVFINTFTSIAEVVGGAISTVIGFIQSLFDALNNLFTGGGGSGKGGDTLAKGIAEDLTAGFDGLDLAELIQRFGAGIASFVQRAIEAVPGLLIALGDLLGIPILRTIGESLENGTFEEGVGRIANAVKDFISDALSRVPGLLQDIGSTLIRPLIDKIEEALSVENIGTGIVDISQAIRNLLDAALQLLGKSLVGLGTGIGNDFLIALGGALEKSDTGAAFEILVNGIGDVLKAALQAAGNLLIGVGDFLGVPLITKIGEALKEPSLAGAIGILAQAVADTVISALKLVPDLLIGLGILIGAPILEKIGNELKEGKLGEAAKTLVDGLVFAITDALGAIPEGLINLGNLLGIEGLKDLGEALKSAGWTQFADTLGRIATFAFDKVVAFIDSLLAIIAGFAEHPESLTLLKDFAIALGIVAGIKNFGAVLGFLTSAVKFAGAFAVFEIVTATLDELAEIARGDDALSIATLGDILIRITSDILGLAGVELSPDEIGQRIVHLFSVINYRFMTGFRQLSADINAEVERILLSIANFVTRAEADLAALTPGGGQLQLEIQGLDAIFGDTSLVGAGFFTAVSQAIATSVDPVALATVLASKMQDVRDEFNGLVADGKIEGMTPGEQAALIHVLLNTGSFDQIILDAPPGMGERLLQSYLDINPETARAIDWTPILNQLQANAITQAQQIEAANIVQMLFAAGGLTREQAQPLLDGLRSDFDALQSFIDSSGEVNPLTIPVIIGPQFSTGDGTGAPQDLTGIVRDFLNDQTAPLQSATPFQLPVEIDAASEFIVVTATTEDIETAAQEAYDQAVKEGAFLPRVAVPAEVEIVPTTINTDKVDEAFEGIKTKAQETAGQIDQTVISIQTFGQTTLDQTAGATVSWVSHAIVMIAQGFLIRAQIDGITAGIIRMKDETLIAQSTIQTATVSIAGSFSALNLTTAEPLDAMLRRLRDIRDVTTGVATALTDLGIIGGAQSATVPGRRRGGDVRAGKPYEIIEDGISELLTVSGRTYLIPGKNGHVDPLGGSRSSWAPGPTVNKHSSSSSNVNINEGDVHITVQGGSARDAAAIADSVGRRFEGIREASREDVRRRLINGGRTGV